MFCKHKFHNLILMVGLIGTGFTASSFLKLNEFKHLVVLFLLFQVLFLLFTICIIIYFLLLFQDVYYIPCLLVC